MKHYLIIIISVLTHFSAIAQWEPLSYEFDLNINDIFYDGKTLYVASDSGLFISGDLGYTFQPVTSGLKYQTKCNSITKFRNDIYVATNAGIFKSSNNITWTNVAPTPTIKVVSTSRFILANTSSRNVTTSDSGMYWHSNPPPVTGSEFSSNSDYILLGQTADYTGLYKLNTMKIWERIPFVDPGPDQYGLIIGHLDTDGKYAAVINQKPADMIAFTNDNGKTWSNSSLPKYLVNYENKVELLDSNTILYSLTNFVISYNGGEHWTSIKSGLHSDTIINVVKSAGDYLYIGTRNGYSSRLYRRKLSDFQGITYSGQGNLQAPVMPGGSYQWYLGNNKIASETTSSLKATTNGTYKVVITYTSPTSRVSAVKTITYSYTVNELITGFSLVSNNIKSSTYLKGQNNTIEITSAEEMINAVVTISNTLGQVVYLKQYEKLQTATLGSFAKGMYVLKIAAHGNILFTGKVIVE